MKPVPNDSTTNLTSPLESYTNWRGGLKAKIHAAQQEQMASADNWFTRTLKSRAELLAKHLPNMSTWAYGSRVNGDAHDASDLDLVLRSPDLTPIDTGRLAAFKDALSESNIPIMVDARDWARLPASFHAQIKRQYVVLIEPI